MNTFDIYLKGGQVVTIKTAHTWKEIIEYAFFEDERDILLTFNHVTFLKSHISAIKDRTKEKELEREIVMSYEKDKPDWLINSVPAQYKPWEEQK